MTIFDSKVFFLIVFFFRLMFCPFKNSGIDNGFKCSYYKFRLIFQTTKHLDRSCMPLFSKRVVFLFSLLIVSVIDTRWMTVMAASRQP